MTNNLTMKDLYKKLNSLGFSKEFIRAIGLPSWWTDELDSSTDLCVVYEAAGHISKRLFIDLKSLIDITQEAKFKTNMSYDNITYETVIEILRESQNYLRKHPIEEMDINELSEDTLDYYEQLLLLEL